MGNHFTTIGFKNLKSTSERDPNKISSNARSKII